MSESVAVVWCRTGVPGTEIGVEVGADGEDVTIEIGDKEGIVLRLSRRKAFALASVLKEAAQAGGIAEAMEQLPKFAARIGLPLPEQPLAAVRSIRLTDDELPPNGAK